MNIVTGSHQVATAFTVAGDERIGQVKTMFAKINTAGLFAMKVSDPEIRYYWLDTAGKMVQVYDRSHIEQAIRMSFYKVEITGTVPGIPGYEIVGRIDERDGPRVIFNFSDIDTAVHRTRPLYCAHCNTAHRRTSTYLFKNIETRELFQVGNSCVAHYTGTAQDITKIMLKIFGMVESFGFQESDTDEADFGSSGKQVFNTKNVLQIALAIAKREGKYTRQNMDYNEIGTGGMVANYLFNNTEGAYKAAIRAEIPAQETDADSIIAHIMSINPETMGRFADYYFNLQSLIEGEYISARRINMVASMTAIYFRNKTEAITYKDEYLGTEGQKFANVECAVIRFSMHETQFGTSQKVILRTSTGHKLTWWNNKCDVKDSDKILKLNFKIKGIDTYDKNDKAVNIFYVKRA